MLPVPFARRCVLMSAVGPDAIGSNPGIECVQMPDRSGIGVALFGCANNGAAATNANVATRRKFRCRDLMLSSLSDLRPKTSPKMIHRARDGFKNPLASMAGLDPAK